MKRLKTHLKEIHPQEVKCGMCDVSFTRNCDLEGHMEAQHKASKKFECNKCELKFFLNWRLKNTKLFTQVKISKTATTRDALLKNRGACFLIGTPKYANLITSVQRIVVLLNIL